MPTYQYECGACGHAFEIYQAINDDKLKQCPECQKMSLQRLIGTGSGLIFKGKGFYETDYKRKPTAEPPCQAGGKTSCPCPCDKAQG